jgi:hypothetical protein
MKRLLALVAGGLGLRALLRRRSRPALSPSPAEDLQAKLAETKVAEPEPMTVPEPETQTPAGSVESRRSDVHAKARQALDELGEP